MKPNFQRFTVSSEETRQQNVDPDTKQFN